MNTPFTVLLWEDDVPLPVGIVPADIDWDHLKCLDYLRIMKYTQRMIAGVVFSTDILARVVGGAAIGAVTLPLLAARVEGVIT